MLRHGPPQSYTAIQRYTALCITQLSLYTYHYLYNLYRGCLATPSDFCLARRFAAINNEWRHSSSTLFAEVSMPNAQREGAPQPHRVSYDQ